MIFMSLNQLNPPL